MVAADVSLHSDSYNCKTCRWGRHCDDTNPAPDARFIHVIGKGKHVFYESKTCPLSYIDDFSRLMVSLHHDYKNNHLPFGGGTMNQPETFRRSMELIDMVHADYG